MVQSIWVKAGFKNAKKLYICHVYREHTSVLGSSLSDQRELFSRFLRQWELALEHGNPSETNELHIAGDVNLDVLGNKWLQSSYQLLSLSRMVEEICNLHDFSQLVTQPTRFQYNRVKGTTDMSCRDHAYTVFIDSIG